MIKSNEARRFIWIFSLTLGLVIYCIMLFTLPGAPNIEVIRKNLIELVVTIIIYWAAGFVLVWAVRWLTKFMLKYGPFM